jgi:hypothetical protein
VEVVHCEPAFWYLFREGGHLYFDINCTQSAVSFSILMQLDDDEAAEYNELGRVFLEYLAAKVSFRPIPYWSRNLTGSLAEETREAVTSWQRAQEGRPPTGK